MAPAALDAAQHTRRLIAVRLQPFLFVLYITNYLDRTSLAYAALAEGMLILLFSGRCRLVADGPNGAAPLEPQ